MKRVFAGVDYRDLERMSNGESLTLSEEVVASIRRTAGRTGSVNLFDIIQELVKLTGAAEDDVQHAFDIAYQDHRISIDKDGFVKLVNSRKARSRGLKNARSSRNDRLSQFVSRFEIPGWVRDPLVWKSALADSDVADPLFWGKVVLGYRRLGGRVIMIRDKTAAVQTRPFDVHAPIWTVSADGMLQRDIKEIQGFLADGVSPAQLENELVQAGFNRDHAAKLIGMSLDSEILI